MEIRNLLTFVQVAELNSFTKASKVLGYSQSTVSFQIKQLEEELDCLLFERINKTIALTEKGEELLKYAKQINQLTDDFNQQHTEPHLLKGTLRIAAPDSVCEDMMTTNYADFHKTYPNISLTFATGDTADMFRKLDHNEADVMLTLDRHVYNSDYMIAKEEQVNVHFVAGANTRFNANKALKIQDILEYPFLLTEHGVGYRAVLDRELAKRSFEVKPILEIGRTDIIVDALINGVGISVLPDFVTKEKVKQGELVYLNITDIQLEIWKQLIYHKNKWLSKPLCALIDYIKEHEFGR